MKKIFPFLKDSLALIIWLWRFVQQLLIKLLRRVLDYLRHGRLLQSARQLEQGLIKQLSTHLPAEPQRFWQAHHRIVLKIIYISLIIWCLVSIAKCSYTPSKIVVKPVIEGNYVSFTGTNKPINGIKVVDLSAGSTQIISLPGRLVWNEEKTAKMLSPFSGRVQSVEVQLGQVVKKGQVLATIQSPDFGVAQADAKKSQAQARLAKNNLTRAKDLYQHGILSKREYDQIQADAEQAEAEYQRAHARLKNLDSDYQQVNQIFALKATQDGMVVERNIYPGREITSDASAGYLFTITDPSHLWATLEAAEVDLGRFAIGAEISLYNNAIPSQKLTGKIIQIADFVDPVTRTIRVRAEVPNNSRLLRAEMYVQGDIPLSNIEGIVVPAKAVFLVGTHHFVFVEVEQNKFARRGVALGARFADKVEVMEGLKPEDRVVLEGNLYLNEILRDHMRSQGSRDPSFITPAKPILEDYPLDVHVGN